MVKNKDVIAVDQDSLGKQATIVQSGNGYDVLSRPLANGDRAVVLFNKGDTAQTITTSAKTAASPAPGIYGLKDLVSKQQTTSNGTISANVPPHGSVMYRISKFGSPLAAPSVAVSVTGSNPATVTVADNGILPLSNVSVGLTAPSGWTVSPATKTLPTVLPGHSASATFTVSAPPPPPGQATNTLTATASYRWLLNKGSSSATQTRITNTPYDNLAQAFNNIAITDESNTTPGNFDGGGDSYSAQALATAGASPGGTVTHKGASFTWPSAASGTNDNVITSGQIIKLPGTGNARRLPRCRGGRDQRADDDHLHRWQHQHGEPRFPELVLRGHDRLRRGTCDHHRSPGHADRSGQLRQRLLRLLQHRAGHTRQDGRHGDVAERAGDPRVRAEPSSSSRSRWRVSPPAGSGTG